VIYYAAGGSFAQMLVAAKGVIRMKLVAVL
jgi:hypothetical protein